MYRRILVAIDGSSASRRALDHALKLADESRARVRLLNVVDESIAAALTMQPEEIARSGYVVRSLREPGQKALTAGETRAARRHLKVETQQKPCRGRPAAETIVQAAKRWRADIIVMGTHGRRGWNRLMLGSTAEGVVRAAPVPVLLVRTGRSQPRGRAS